MNNDPIQYWKDVLSHYGQTYTKELIHTIANDINATENEVVNGIKMISAFQPEKERERPSWDEYFMMEAVVVTSRSHDIHTRHGAVIVNSDNIPQGQGYNGFPSGGKNPYPTTRPEKYPFVIHSELNAILNCPFRPKGCTIYITGKPCSSCIKDIIQSGIRKIIYGKIGSAMVDDKDWGLTTMMAENHGVELVEYKGPTPIRGLLELVEYLKEKGWTE